MLPCKKSECFINVFFLFQSCSNREKIHLKQGKWFIRAKALDTRKGENKSI